MSRSSSPAVLLVDGYNIIGNWSNLKHICNHDGMEAARRTLIEALVNYSAYQGYDTRLVFDAHYQETRSTIEEVTPYLSVHFTNFGETADTYIEKMCATYRHEISRLNRRIIVATSDRVHQLTVVGYGAEWMSAQQLAFDIDSTGKRVRRKQKNRQKSARGFLASSLDPEAQQRLAQLRFGKH
jgi:predicted RNA-binding protein with PIN domain